MTVFSNGYIVTVDDRVYGPYLNYDDAYEAHKKQGNRRIQALNHNPLAVRVLDCDKTWCAHCQVKDK
jgi:hypothetical protein